MADTKISNLTSAGALAGTEVVPLVQSGSTKKTTVQDIANLASYSLPTATASVKGGVKVGNGLQISSEVLSQKLSGFTVYRATNQTGLALNYTNNTITFSNTQVDTDSFWSAGSPTLITFPRTGKVCLSARVQFQGVSSGKYNYMIILPSSSWGLTLAGDTYTTVSTDAHSIQIVPTIVNVTAGDTCTLVIGTSMTTGSWNSVGNQVIISGWYLE